MMGDDKQNRHQTQVLWLGALQHGLELFCSDKTRTQKRLAEQEQTQVAIIRGSADFGVSVFADIDQAIRPTGDQALTFERA